MICKFCRGQVDELRLGCCYDCAEDGERRAACRTVLQHMGKCLGNLWRGKWEYARFDATWAWQRLTRTGDYAPFGYFDWEGHDWRKR